MRENIIAGGIVSLAILIALSKVTQFHPSISIVLSLMVFSLTCFIVLLPHCNEYSIRTSFSATIFVASFAVALSGIAAPVLTEYSHTEAHSIHRTETTTIGTIGTNAYVSERVDIYKADDNDIVICIEKNKNAYNMTVNTKKHLCISKKKNEFSLDNH